jgi:FMN phosphatase YigB (HAD superfamily)
MIKAVIFDIGDVLVNFGWREFLEKNFDDPDLREELAREVFEHETWGYCDAHDLSLEEEINKGYRAQAIITEMAYANSIFVIAGVIYKFDTDRKTYDQMIVKTDGSRENIVII